jgi:hypothetical protein
LGTAAPSELEDLEHKRQKLEAQLAEAALTTVLSGVNTALFFFGAYKRGAIAPYGWRAGGAWLTKAIEEVGYVSALAAAVSAFEAYLPESKRLSLGRQLVHGFQWLSGSHDPEVPRLNTQTSERVEQLRSKAPQSTLVGDQRITLV